jgi:hypothetical protein
MGFFNFPVLAAAVHVLAVLIYFVYPYLSNEPLRRIPGPFVARFTNVWLFLQARRGRRYVAVNDAHRRFGPVVRIAPNHVSIVDPDAVNMIYGHGNGFTKRYARCIVLWSVIYTCDKRQTGIKMLL